MALEPDSQSDEDQVDGVDADPEAPAAPSLADLPRMSATILRFGAPLLDLLDDPPTPEELRNALTIVCVAWNLPLYEKHDHPEGPGFRRIWDAALENVPPLRRVLLALQSSRMNEYADDPRLVTVEVVPGTDGEGEVVATATLLTSAGTG